MKKKKILIVSTGGTISSKYDGEKGYSPVISAQELGSSLGGAEGIADIETVQFCNVLSFALEPNQVLELVNMIRTRLADEDYAGAVVTQGTATMEETSYLADLMWDVEKPLVFTGAMLNASERDWDGARNVRNSVLVAANPKSRGKGVLVCMGGEIHAARDVSKIHKTSLNTFVSLNVGPLGLVSNNRVIFYRNPILRKVFAPVEILETNVEILKVSLGSSSKILDLMISEGYKGIVIESLPGGGGVTPEIMDSIRRAQGQDIVFVQTPRSPMGTSVSRASGGCGPWDLRQCGVINGGDLTSVKARILLMVTLPVVDSKMELKAIFDEIAP
ncbi:MAG TPA: asparaginase [Bacillota bacterium]|nr:asparaginase [Bacillota bacterium]